MIAIITIGDIENNHRLFEAVGFEADLLEYCDENGSFHYKFWNEEDGRIKLSLRFDTRNSIGKLVFPSIIIDAKNPIIIEI